MKKKLLSFIFAICLIIPAIFMLSACSKYTNKYVVQFYNEDGSLITEIQVDENNAATCPTVSKPGDQYNIYEFMCWEFLNGIDATQDLENVTKTLIVRAKFNAVQPTYTVCFYDEDRVTLLDTKEILRGSDTTFTTNPTKAPDEHYVYDFVSWVDESNEVVDSLTDIRENKVLYAKYEISTLYVPVHFYDEDKTTLVKTDIIEKGQSADSTAPTMQNKNISTLTYIFDFWTDLEGNKLSLLDVQAPTKFYARYGKIKDTQGVYYTLSEDKSHYTVTSCDHNTKVAVIQSSFNSIPVTAIGERAFYGVDLTSVTIPDSVTSIGDYAFYSTDLTSVTIGTNVETIGERAFNSCLQLDSVTFGTSVKSIGNYAFDNARVKVVNYLGEINDWVSIDFVNGYANPVYYGGVLKINNTDVTIANITADKIGAYSFYKYSKLTGVIIDAKVTTVGSDAFDSCQNLVEVIYLGDVNKWVSISFDNYAANPLNSGKTQLKINSETITSANISVATEIKQYAFNGYNALTSVIVGDSVLSIGDAAFRHCSALSNLTLGKNLKTIKSLAFANCEILTNVELGDNVTTIGANAFLACNALTSITISEAVTTIGENAFKSVNEELVVNYLGDINGWVSIDFGNERSNPMCEGSTLLINGEIVTEVVLADTKIDKYGLYCLRLLTSLTIGENVTVESPYTLEYCNNLKLLIIDSAAVANSLVNFCGLPLSDGLTIYIKSGLDVSNSTYLSYLTKQATSDKAGYDMYVRNAE